MILHCARIAVSKLLMILLYLLIPNKMATKKKLMILNSVLCKGDILQCTFFILFCRNYERGNVFKFYNKTLSPCIITECIYLIFSIKIKLFKDIYYSGDRISDFWMVEVRNPSLTQFNLFSVGK